MGPAGFALAVGFLGLPALVGAGRAAGLGAGAHQPEVAPALGLLASGVVMLAIDWTWQIPAAVVPLIVAAGLLVAPAATSTRHTVARTVRRRRASSGGLGSGARWGLGGFAVLAIVAAAMVHLGELRLAESEAAARAGDLRTAAREARSASEWVPWAAEPIARLARVEQRRGRIDAARSAIEDAIEHDSEDWFLWLAAAEIELRARRPTAAYEALIRSRQLNPLAPLPLFRPHFYAVVRQLRARGQVPPAVLEALRELRAEPREGG